MPGGSVLPETDIGGSILSEIHIGDSSPPQTYEHVRSAQQDPSTSRKGRPRRRKSSRARATQLNPSTSPGPDLREQLNKKRRASQVTPHCRCERIIASVLADCTCSSPTQIKSVFERLSATSSAELTKRLRFNDDGISYEDEFIEVSVNVVDKDTGKQPALEPENSATPGVYMRTRSRSGTIRPVNYRALDQGQQKPKEHSAIVESQSSSSSGGQPVHSLAADIPEEIAQQLAIQAQAQRDQQEQLRAQAQTIDTLKILIQQVLERVSKKKSKHAGSTSHSKDRESSNSDSSIRFHSPHEHDDKVEPLVKTDGQSKVEPENKATDSDSGHKMKRLEEQVAALKTTTIRQETGATRPYPVKWDAVKYPSRFKVPTLNTFDGKGSAQQHIYYFESQTGSLMGNDPVRTRLFISTLKGVAFEWFRKLPKGSITCWDDLKALFLSRFFEEEANINMHTLLLTKQKERELVKDFIERFRKLAMRS